MTELYILTGYLSLLALLGALDDLVVRKIGPLARYIETLPMMKGD